MAAFCVIKARILYGQPAKSHKEKEKKKEYHQLRVPMMLFIA
jgi:hypothetical protein